MRVEPKLLHLKAPTKGSAKVTKFNIETEKNISERPFSKTQVPIRKIAANIAINKNNSENTLFRIDQIFMVRFIQRQINGAKLHVSRTPANANTKCLARS